MSLFKLARMSKEQVYTKATANALKHEVEGNEDWFRVNKRAKKVTERYNRMADYIEKRNKIRGIKAGLLGATLIGGVYAYKKHKDKK